MKSGSITMFLVKFLPEEEWVKELISGKIYMNRLSCFKRLEEQQVSNRADRHEGVSGWFQPGGTHATINGMDISSDLAGPIEIQRDWLNDLNIFCMNAAHTGDLDEPFAKFASRWDLLPGRVVIPGSAGVPPAQDLAGSWRLASQGWSVHLPTGAGAAPLQECGRDARAPRGKPMAGQVQIRILQKARI